MTVDPTASSSETSMSAGEAIGHLLLDGAFAAAARLLVPAIVCVVLIGGVLLLRLPPVPRISDRWADLIWSLVAIGAVWRGSVLSRRDTLQRLADEIWQRRYDEEDAAEDEDWELVFGPSFEPDAPRLGDPLARWWPPVLDQAVRQHKAHVEQVIAKRRVANERDASHAARHAAALAHPITRRAHAIVRHARAVLVQMLVGLIGVGLLVAVAVWIIGLVRYFFTF
jgi:hypothetical protein